MPTEVNGVLRYDIHDEADLAVLIRTGLIWRGGPEAVDAATEYLKAHPEAVNEQVPASVTAALSPAPAATAAPAPVEADSTVESVEPPLEESPAPPVA